MVNAGLLKKYLGRRVTTVVKVFRSDGADLVGQAPDGISITVRKAASSSITLSHFVEVVGVVEGESALRAEICTNFGDAFDMVTYNQLCQLANCDNRDCFV